ncbi:unnamed protein product, partial [Didymodactylos carnosus]
MSVLPQADKITHSIGTARD